MIDCGNSRSNLSRRHKRIKISLDLFALPVIFLLRLTNTFRVFDLLTFVTGSPCKNNFVFQYKFSTAIFALNILTSKLKLYLLSHWYHFNKLVKNHTIKNVVQYEIMSKDLILPEVLSIIDFSFLHHSFLLNLQPSKL